MNNPNLKPIFDEERQGILKHNNINIPPNCWKDGNKIYLNIDSEFPIIILSVDLINSKIIIKNNFIDSISKDNKYVHLKGKYRNKNFDYIEYNKTHKEELKNKEIIKHLNKLFGESVKYTIACMKNNIEIQWRLSDSTGKDSLLCYEVFKYSMEKLNKKYEFEVDYFNTTNEVGDSYKVMKEHLYNFTKYQLINKNKNVTDEEINNTYKENYKKWCHNPKVGYYDYIENKKNYYLPTTLSRHCCSTYKEGKLKEVIDKNQKVILFLGMRNQESAKRSYYDFYLNEAVKKKEKKEGKKIMNVPENWIRFLPIVNWSNTDVWLYIIWKDLKVNPMYYNGFDRVGCIICPMMRSYNFLLVRYYYPKIADRWRNIVEKNYEDKNIGKILKLSKDEYILGAKWKTPISKEYEILQKKPTEKNIQALADIKGISYNMAEKYFDKKCICGKKLNPDEIAINYKLFGRYEDKTAEEDTRELYCKQCLCKKLNITTKEYNEKIIEFRNQDCKLF